jgi:hypothetical protein
MPTLGHSFERRRIRFMTKKIITLALGLTLASGLAFCKKEEAAVEEKMESTEAAVKDALSDAEKKAIEAKKAAEAEATKKVGEGVNAAKDAVNTKLP